MKNEATKPQRDKRTDVLLKNPLTELCLHGGLDMLADDERGPLDKKSDPSSPYYDERLLLPLDEAKVLNVNLLGVLETILVTRVGDVLVVLEGRQRVRWARAANKLRAARGEPLLLVKCDPVRAAATDPALALAVMIAGNEVRTDDNINVKIDKLKRMMARGVDVHTAAAHFGKPVGVIESWLRFDDNAIDDVKRAVEAGQLALSAGKSIAGLPREQQREALQQLAEKASNGKISARNATRAAKQLRGNALKHEGISDKKTQRKLYELAQRVEHAKGASKETLAWWSGVEAALALIAGTDEEIDERLLTLLGKTRVEAKEPSLADKCGKCGRELGEHDGKKCPKGAK